jgi:hypothetical protein
MFCPEEMPRKRFPITIDTRLIDGVKSAASDAGISNYMEQLLTGHLKNLGKLPMDARPLPEVRGGVRPNSGRPKKNGTPDDASPIEPTTTTTPTLSAAADSDADGDD